MTEGWSESRLWGSGCWWSTGQPREAIRTSFRSWGSPSESSGRGRPILAFAWKRKANERCRTVSRISNEDYCDAVGQKLGAGDGVLQGGVWGARVAPRGRRRGGAVIGGRGGVLGGRGVAGEFEFQSG